MAQSYIDVLGDGTSTAFSFSFGYIDRSHLAVSVDGVNTTFSFITSSTLDINPAPANNAVVRIARVTPNDPIVNFRDGETLTEADLDKVSLQSLYLAQESEDTLSVTITEDTDGSLDAKSRRLKNVATPLLAADAATKEYVDARSNSLEFYFSRSALETAVVEGAIFTVGAVVMAGGYSYEFDGASTTLAGLPGFQPHGATVHLAQWDVLGIPLVKDPDRPHYWTKPTPEQAETAMIAAAFRWAVTNKRNMSGNSSRVYGVSYPITWGGDDTINSGADDENVVSGAPLFLRDVGLSTTGAYAIGTAPDWSNADPAYWTFGKAVLTVGGQEGSSRLGVEDCWIDAGYITAAVYETDENDDYVLDEDGNKILSTPGTFVRHADTAMRVMNNAGGVIADVRLVRFPTCGLQDAHSSPDNPGLGKNTDITYTRVISSQYMYGDTDMTSDAQYAHRTATACHMSSADSKHQSCNYYMSKHAVTTGQLYNLRIVNTGMWNGPIRTHASSRTFWQSAHTYNTQIAACRIDDGQAYFQNARTQVSNTRFIQYDFHNQVTLVATRVDDDFAAFIFTGNQTTKTATGPLTQNYASLSNTAGSTWASVLKMRWSDNVVVGFEAPENTRALGVGLDGPVSISEGEYRYRDGSVDFFIDDQPAAYTSGSLHVRKHPDGTMIIRGRVALSYIAATYCSLNFTFPEAFIGWPDVQIALVGDNWPTDVPSGLGRQDTTALLGNLTSTAVSAQVWSATGHSFASGDAPVVSVTAIGFWK